jgi:hypothetical protein
MNVTTINQWLSAMGAAIGQPLDLDDRGLLAIELQGGLLCTIEFNSVTEVLTFHSDVLSLDSHKMSAINDYAMQKNLYCSGSYGLTLGIDKSRAVLVASTCFPLSALTEESFLIFFERFVSAVEENYRDFQRVNMGTSVSGAVK